MQPDRFNKHLLQLPVGDISIRRQLEKELKRDILFACTKDWNTLLYSYSSNVFKCIIKDSLIFQNYEFNCVQFGLIISLINIKLKLICFLLRGTVYYIYNIKKL